MWSPAPNNMRVQVEQYRRAESQSMTHDVLERVTTPNLLSPLKVNKPSDQIRKLAHRSRDGTLFTDLMKSKNNSLQQMQAFQCVA
jgi:hypothetical protein